MIRYLILLAGMLWVQAAFGFDPALLGKHFLHPQVKAFVNELGADMPANRQQFQLSAPDKGIILSFGQGGFLTQVSLFNQSMLHQAYAGALPQNISWEKKQKPKQWIKMLKPEQITAQGANTVLSLPAQPMWHGKLKINADGRPLEIQLFPSDHNLKQGLAAFQEKVATKWISLDAEGLSRLLGKDLGNSFATDFFEDPRNGFSKKETGYWKHPTYTSISKGVRVDYLQRFYPRILITEIEFFRAGIYGATSSFLGELPGGFTFTHDLWEQLHAHDMKSEGKVEGLDTYTYSLDAEKELFLEAKGDDVQRILLRFKPEVAEEIRRKAKLEFKINKEKDELAANSTVVFKVGPLSPCISGNCKDGIGTFEQKTKEGQVQRYTGQFEDFFAEGEGKVAITQGGKPFMQIEGTFVKGKAFGKGKIISYEGDKRVEFEGDIKDNLRHGQGKELSYVNNELESTYEGAFAYGQRQGQGVLEKPNGMRYEGNFGKNQISGEGTMYVPEEKATIKGRFSNGKPNGKVTVYLPTGTIEEMEMSNGKRQGESILKIPGGKRVEGYYINDLKEGVFVFYQDGVKVKSVFYKKGIQTQTINH